MVVLSVQICVSLRVLKGWGLHPLDELATLAEVLGQFARSEMEGCSSFVFPVLKEQPFKCYITPTLSGPFQTVFHSARMGEVQLFGKYLKYVITSSDQPASVNVGEEQPCDAFRLLMDIQVTLRVPKKVMDE